MVALPGRRLEHSARNALRTSSRSRRAARFVGRHHPRGMLPHSFASGTHGESSVGGLGRQPGGALLTRWANPSTTDERLADCGLRIGIELTSGVHSPCATRRCRSAHAQSFASSIRRPGKSAGSNTVSPSTTAASR